MARTIAQENDDMIAAIADTMTCHHCGGAPCYHQCPFSGPRERLFRVRVAGRHR